MSLLTNRLSRRPVETRERRFGRDRVVDRDDAYVDDRRGLRRGGGDAGLGARLGLARLITTIASIVATIIVAAIVLILLKANPDNDIVNAVREAGRFLAGPFDVIFEMDKRRTEIAVNWGLAAVVYTFVARLLARLLVGSAVAD